MGIDAELGGNGGQAPEDPGWRRGGGLAAGYLLSALLMVALGALGFVSVLTKVFNPIVISVFLFLLTVQLEMNFFSGMLAVDGEGRAESFHCRIIGSYGSVRRLALLEGERMDQQLCTAARHDRRLDRFRMAVSGYSSATRPPPSILPQKRHSPGFLGERPRIEIGIMITSFVVGLVNMSNTVTALSSAEKLYKRKTTNAQYRRSLVRADRSVQRAIAGVRTSPFRNVRFVLSACWRVRNFEPFRDGYRQWPILPLRTRSAAGGFPVGNAP
ncbi:permease family protein [Cohnella faecalis]|uniref:hypothetical protein n=1 Tax=Cohnella faecalis TaxID=2315694 RepID=UPI001314768A|nr:hypothetical protein [Cohnella faecalis]